MSRLNIQPVVAIVAVFAVLLAPAGTVSTLWMRGLQDAAHGPLFAILAAGTVSWLRQVAPQASVTTHYLTALFLTMLLGGTGELAQALFTTDREAAWSDLMTDGLGAVFGLGLMACREPRQRISSKLKLHVAGPAACAAGCAMVLPLVGIGLEYWQRKEQLPELLTWSSASNGHLTLGSGSVLRGVLQNQAPGFPKTGPSVEISPQQNAAWPGITLEEPWPDWSPYKTLEIVMENPNPDPLTLHIRIEDRKHNNSYEDRFNQSATLPPLSTINLKFSTEQIRLGPARRELELNHIKRLILFQDGAHNPRRLILHRLRLIE